MKESVIVCHLFSFPTSDTNASKCPSGLSKARLESQPIRPTCIIDIATRPVVTITSAPANLKFTHHSSTWWLEITEIKASAMQTSAMEISVSNIGQMTRWTQL